MLGGMWGFFNARNKELANYIYQIITDRTIASQFNNGNQKGNDQFLLSCILIILLSKWLFKVSDFIEKKCNLIYTRLFKII